MRGQVAGRDGVCRSRAPFAGHRVPTVLAVLRRRLAEAEGLTSEGVFRIAPDEGDTRALKHALNEQQWETRVDDVNAYAHLIKVRACVVIGECVCVCVSVTVVVVPAQVWFRELPTHALSSVAEKDLMAAQSEEACAAVVRAMPGEAGERLRWLLAVLARVVAQSAVNRMNVHACGAWGWRGAVQGWEKCVCCGGGVGIEGAVCCGGAVGRERDGCGGPCAPWRRGGSGEGWALPCRCSGPCVSWDAVGGGGPCVALAHCKGRAARCLVGAVGHVCRGRGRSCLRSSHAFSLPPLVSAPAVVVGPNLYTPQADVDPLTALRMSQQAVDFLKLALEWWVRTSEEP